MKSEHYEFPFFLEADGIVDDNTFNTAVLPIRHILNNLEESGSRPHALSDARGAFDRMIEKVITGLMKPTSLNFPFSITISQPRLIIINNGRKLLH